MPTKDMVARKNEDRYYSKLERTFKEMKHQEYFKSKQRAVQQLRIQMEDFEA